MSSHLPLLILLLLLQPWSSIYAQEGAGELSSPPVGATHTEPKTQAAKRTKPTTSKKSSPVSVEVSLGSTAPVDVWAGVSLVLYKRLLLGATVGRSAYSGLLGTIADNAYGEQAGAVVRPLLGNAWNIRLSIGVRPFGIKGPELTFGYARLSASASISGEDLSLPGAGVLSAEVALSMYFLEIGWTVSLSKRFFLRPAVGWTKSLGASVALSSDQASSGQARQVLDDAEQTAVESLVEFGRTPTLSLSFGARF